MGRVGYLARSVPHQERELAKQDPYSHFMVSIVIISAYQVKADDLSLG